MTRRYEPPSIDRPGAAVWLAVVIAVLILAGVAQAGSPLAAGDPQAPATWSEAFLGEGGLKGWVVDIRDQITRPLFWFGMGAQLMFFMRFIWQWIVSERRGHSTVPIAFWYFSLAGGVAMFTYGVMRREPVILTGQSLACVIYVRNLMLIYRQAKQRREAGLSPVKLRSEVVGEEGDQETKP